MRIYPSARKLARLQLIEKAVRSAGKHKMSMHAPCVPDLLYGVIEQIQPDKQSGFADLGSAFGMACFTASLYFEKVVGFEIDQQVLMEAQKIAQQLGIQNVSFLNQDFRAADLSDFGVLHIYQPYVDNFVSDMRVLFAGLRPGTLIISGLYDRMQKQIFDQSRYRQVFPSLSKPPAFPSLIHVHEIRSD
jgi:hypothetical protein